jgi:putative ABC transport system permease protein
MDWLRQSAVVSRLNIRSIPRRFLSSASSVLAVTLVIVVLLGFLGMADGFRNTLTSSGSDDIAVVYRGASQSEFNSVVSSSQIKLLAQAPGVARGADGRPLISPELYLAISGVERDSQRRANIPLRGVSPDGARLHKSIRFTEGRMYHAGSDEIVAGADVIKRFEGFELGSTITLGGSKWTVVGVMASDGTVFGSELWADPPVVQSLFKRTNVFQTVRLQLGNAADLQQLKFYVDGEPRLKLEVKSEAAYFADQSSRVTNLIQNVGWPLAIAMAIGAVAGALNTMYSSVAARAGEIATLRAIGFSAASTFLGTMCESLAVAMLGGIIGSLVAYFAFDGLAATTLGNSFTQVAFNLKLSGGLMAKALALSIAIGLVGGMAPAWRSARIGIVEGLRG